MEPGHVGSFASVLRQLRTQAGLSLRGLGKLALYDYSRLSRAERGEILPPEPQVQMLDTVLHANGLLITLWRTAPEGPAASTATASALRTAHEWLVSEPPQLLRQRAGRRIGAAQAAQIQDRVIQLQHLDDHLSGRDLAPVVLREYKATAAIIDQASYRETTGRLLLSSLAELAQITGSCQTPACTGRPKTITSKAFKPHSKPAPRTSLRTCCPALPTSGPASASTMMPSCWPPLQRRALGAARSQSYARCSANGSPTPAPTRETSTAPLGHLMMSTTLMKPGAPAMTIRNGPTGLAATRSPSWPHAAGPGSASQAKPHLS